MSKLLNKYSLRKSLLASTLISLLLLPVLLPSSTNAELQAAAIAQSFETDESKVVEGALVSLQPGKPGSVELASASNAHQLVGVVGKDPLIELGGGNGNVQVITNGTALALVSDLDGEVKTGDKITASPILGIGTKASSGVMVVGTAQADLSSVKTTEHFITDTDGQVHTVKIGLIPTQVSVAFFSEPGSKTYVPEFLQELANSVAGRQVSPLKVIIAVLILILSFVSIAVLLYAAVKSSIISIGRNPLSASSVRKGLLQASLAVIGILAASVTVVILILKT
jgi:hypothetical protein